MSKFNYNKPIANEENEVLEQPKVVTGFVSECAKLNVRKLPYTSADVRCVVNLGDKVIIDEEGSTDLFYKVKTSSGVDGYCMRKYVEIR